MIGFKLKRIKHSTLLEMVINELPRLNFFPSIVPDDIPALEEKLACGANFVTKYPSGEKQYFFRISGLNESYDNKVGYLYILYGANGNWKRVGRVTWMRGKRRSRNQLWRTSPFGGWRFDRSEMNDTIEFLGLLGLSLP